MPGRCGEKVEPKRACRKGEPTGNKRGPSNSMHLPGCQQNSPPPHPAGPHPQPRWHFLQARERERERKHRVEISSNKKGKKEGTRDNNSHKKPAPLLCSRQAPSTRGGVRLHLLLSSASLSFFFLATLIPARVMSVKQLSSALF